MKTKKKDSEHCGKCGRKKVGGRCPACGRPRTFPDPASMWRSFLDYIEYCTEEDKFPNFVGFSVFCGTYERAMYEYKRRDKEFSTTIEAIEGVLLEFTLQKGMEKSNPFVQFYMKNKFKWSDKQEIEHSGRIEMEQKMKRLIQKLKDRAKLSEQE